jgi:hypothetical protein
MEKEDGEKAGWPFDFAAEHLNSKRLDFGMEIKWSPVKVLPGEDERSIVLYKMSRGCRLLGVGQT